LISSPPSHQKVITVHIRTDICTAVVPTVAGWRQHLEQVDQGLPVQVLGLGRDVCVKCLNSKNSHDNRAIVWHVSFSLALAEMYV
jgi:hypothetical protein